MGIKAVTQQRMADGKHVYPQLMRAAGDGGQFDPAPVAAALQHSPEGQGVLAEFVVHHMPGFGWRIITQGQIDAAAVQFRLAPAQGGVGLFGFAVMKLSRQFAMGISVPGQENDARGFPIQPVDDTGFGVAVFLQASDQAVLVVVGATGD